MSVRVAVIGAGIMGADHARILSGDIPGATLQVVCDASEVRAREVADACGARHVLTDPAGVATRDDVDAVLVASPDDTHADLTLAALDVRKPVLCEKPLAPSVEDCLRVIEAEAAVERQLVQVGFMRRFDPSYVEMRVAVAGGMVGKPLMMHNFHRNVEAPSWFTGSMAITNSAPHEFDIARFILDADIAAISAFQPQTGAGRSMPVLMVLETEAGHLVTIEVNNNAAYGYDVRGEVVGEAGAISLGAPVHAIYDTALRSETRYAADWRPRFAEAYRVQDRAWIDSIQTGVPSTSAASAWDGYRATAVAEAGVAALRDDTKVSVECIEKPMLYAGLASAA